MPCETHRVWSLGPKCFYSLTSRSGVVSSLSFVCLETLGVNTSAFLSNPAYK